MILSESFKHDEVLGLRFGQQLIGRPKLVAHLYFVDGLLIDTGQRKRQKQILEATKDLQVQQIFLTHHHEDHTGNINALRDQHSCEVYAPEKCCQLMKNPPKLSYAQKRLWGDREAEENITPKDKTITTPNFGFEQIPIPGHASDMVALYEPNKKWLFSADLYINFYIGYMLDNESIATQIQSIKRVLKLDFDVLFCSHNPKLTNGKQQLQKKLDYLELFYDQVATLYNQGNSELQIFQKLKLEENWFVRLFSGGKLSKLNMVRAVLRDEESSN